MATVRLGDDDMMIQIGARDTVQGVVGHGGKQHDPLPVLPAAHAAR